MTGNATYCDAETVGTCDGRRIALTIWSCYPGPEAATLGAMKSEILVTPPGRHHPRNGRRLAVDGGAGHRLRSHSQRPPAGHRLGKCRFQPAHRVQSGRVLGRRPSELLHFESSDPETKQRIRESFDAGRGLRFEILVRSKDGHEWWLDTDARPLLDAEGKLKGWVCIHADVTNEVLKREARKVSEQRISFLAYHDGLTGLVNRLGLRSKLDEMLHASYRANVSLAVLMIDLDRFKYVNDTLGHDVGDELLVEIARRLRSTVRACDVVARLGGDEFVLVLDDLPDEAHVIAAVQKLFRQLRGNFRLSDRTVYTTCSMGISRFPKDGTDGSTLLKHADLAMYTAKANGGDSFRLFESAMRPSTDRLLIEVELRDALERNELEIYYQPRIDTVTGYPTAVEALLRWHHPTRGLVLPGLFIPIAEETGLIESIGQWVLSQACYDLRAWLDRGGASLRVSVNLSPIQFAREELPERVAAALDAARLPADLLELEITETVAMRSPELAARHLARLRALGVSLAVDDFGTGHSSLARLKLLNVDCVKIDRSLVEDCTADPHNAALCRAAIALGLALGLEVVAEGVETQEQRQFLTQEHCSTIQGYLVAPPMPAEEVFSLLSSLLEVPRLRNNLAQA